MMWVTPELRHLELVKFTMMHGGEIIELPLGTVAKMLVIFDDPTVARREYYLERHRCMPNTWDDILRIGYLVQKREFIKGVLYGDIKNLPTKMHKKVKAQVPFKL